MSFGASGDSLIVGGLAQERVAIQAAAHTALKNSVRILHIIAGSG